MEEVVCFDVFSFCIYLWTLSVLLCLAVYIQLFVCVDVCLCVFSLASWIALSHHMLLIVSAAQTVFFGGALIFLQLLHIKTVSLCLQNYFISTLSRRRSSFVSVVSALNEKHTQMSLDSFHLTLQKISFLFNQFSLLSSLVFLKRVRHFLMQWYYFNLLPIYHNYRAYYKLWDSLLSNILMHRTSACGAFSQDLMFLVFLPFSVVFKKTCFQSNPICFKNLLENETRQNDVEKLHSGFYLL